MNRGESSNVGDRNQEFRDYKHYKLIRIGQWILITICLMIYTFLYLTSITDDDFLRLPSNYTGNETIRGPVLELFDMDSIFAGKSGNKTKIVGGVKKSNGSEKESGGQDERSDGSSLKGPNEVKIDPDEFKPGKLDEAKVEGTNDPKPKGSDESKPRIFDDLKPEGPDDFKPDKGRDRSNPDDSSNSLDDEGNEGNQGNEVNDPNKPPTIKPPIDPNPTIPSLSDLDIAKNLTLFRAVFGNLMLKISHASVIFMALLTMFLVTTVDIIGRAIEEPINTLPMSIFLTVSLAFTGLVAYLALQTKLTVIHPGMTVYMVLNFVLAVFLLVSIIKILCGLCRKQTD